MVAHHDFWFSKYDVTIVGGLWTHRFGSQAFRENVEQVMQIELPKLVHFGEKIGGLEALTSRFLTNDCWLDDIPWLLFFYINILHILSHHLGNVLRSPLAFWCLFWSDDSWQLMRSESRGQQMVSWCCHFGSLGQESQWVVPFLFYILFASWPDAVRNDCSIRWKRDFLCCLRF